MRIAKIDQFPELKDTLAELTAEGLSQQKIADAMEVSDRGTIAAWQKRPEIQHKVSRLIQERANKILSKTTKKIEAKLDGDEKISLENLLKIQQTFGGQTLKVEGGDPAKALEELFLLAHSDQDLAEGLRKLGLPAPSEEEPRQVEAEVVPDDGP